MNVISRIGPVPRVIRMREFDKERSKSHIRSRSLVSSSLIHLTSNAYIRFERFRKMREDTCLRLAKGLFSIRAGLPSQDLIGSLKLSIIGSGEYLDG